MTASLLLSLALAGQYCGQKSYAASYVAAPSYNYSYSYAAKTYAVPYVEKVKFVAVEPSYDNNYYAAMAGGYIRAEERKKEAAQQQANLESQLANLAEAVSRLERTAAAGLQAPVPSAPPSYAPPPPYAPAPSPQGIPPSPQVPEKNPPPVVPGKVGFGPRFPPSLAPSRQDDELPLQPIRPNAAPPPPPVPHSDWGNEARANPVSFTALNTCVRCHTQGSAKGDFTLFANGQPVGLTPHDLWRLNRVIRDRSMPPDQPLSADQYDALSAWLDDQAEAVLARSGGPAAR